MRLLRLSGVGGAGGPPVPVARTALDYPWPGAFPATCESWVTRPARGPCSLVVLAVVDEPGPMKSEESMVKM